MANIKFKVGDLVRVIACQQGHEFQIGERVTIMEKDNETYLAVDVNGNKAGDAYATALVLVKFLSYVRKQHKLQKLGELLQFQNGKVAAE